MAKTNPRAHLYVARRSKVAARRPPPRVPDSSSASTAEDREGTRHHPLELLLGEIEAVREEVGGIAEYLKTGGAAHSRHK